MNTTPLI